MTTDDSMSDVRERFLAKRAALLEVSAQREQAGRVVRDASLDEKLQKGKRVLAMAGRYAEDLCATTSFPCVQ